MLPLVRPNHNEKGSSSSWLFQEIPHAGQTPDPCPNPQPQAAAPSANSIRRQVDDIKTATSLLKVVQAVENAAAEPKEAQSDAHFRNAFFDLEGPLRDLDNMASLTMQWSLDHIVHHEDTAEDAATNRFRSRQIDHVLFAITEIASKAESLSQTFDAAFDDDARRAKQ